MAYIAVGFQASAADAERWADALLERGALSVDAADPHAGTALETARYGEPRNERATLWPVCRLTALFLEASDVENILIRAGDALGVEAPEHSVETIPDADWVRRTQAQFRPRRVARKLWIVPSWCD